MGCAKWPPCAVRWHCFHVEVPPAEVYEMPRAQPNPRAQGVQDPRGAQVQGNGGDIASHWPPSILGRHETAMRIRCHRTAALH